MPEWNVFWPKYGFPAALVLGQSLLTLVALLLVVAYLLLADRKIWAAIQLRRGPNVVGAFGLLQSFADFIKFVLKEPVIPSGADKTVFLLAPLVTSVLALSAWAVIPVNEGWVVADLNVGILYLFAISSLGVYGVIMGGWASNSKYPFLGSLRSAAQMVSYEVSIGFVIVTVLLCAGSLNLTQIVNAQKGPYGIFNWYWLPLFPMFVIFFVSALAETNRPPCDLPEAESELVAGFMTEYSSAPISSFNWRVFSIVLMCALMSIMFLGGWLPPLGYSAAKLDPRHSLVSAQGRLYVRADLHRQGHRAAIPLRSAYALGWKVFLPFSLVMASPWPASRIRRVRALSANRNEDIMGSFVQSFRAAVLAEFVSAGWLSLKYLFKSKATINYPHEKNPVSPRYRGEHALRRYPNAWSGVSLANCARRSARPKRSRSRLARAGTTARGAQRATTSIW